MKYKLHLDNAINVLRDLPDNSIHLLLTDPPYLTTDLSFDKDGLDYEWVNEALRVVHNDGYFVSFGSIEQLADYAKIWSLRFSGIWLKDRAGMRTHSAKKPRSRQEPFVVYAHPNHMIRELSWEKVLIKGEPYRRKHRNTGYKRDGKDQLSRSDNSGWTKDGFESINHGTREQTDVIEGPTKQCMPLWERTKHPTQKPLKVINKLIKWLTNPGEAVLDCYAGSGTTVYSAVDNMRYCIGVEKNPDYYKIIEDRVKRLQLKFDWDIMYNTNGINPITALSFSEEASLYKGEYHVIKDKQETDVDDGDTVAVDEQIRMI